jgi:hypothetical protein
MTLKQIYTDKNRFYIDTINEQDLQKLYEGLIITHNIKTSKEILLMKFNFLNRIEITNNKIRIKINGNNVNSFVKNLKKINKLLNNLGWEPTNIQYIVNNPITQNYNNKIDFNEIVNDYVFFYVVYEAKYNIEVPVKKTLYHISPYYYKDKILKQGLTHKSKNKKYNYDSRIYFFDDIKMYRQLCSLLLKYIDDRFKLGKDVFAFNLYKINTKHINRLFKDSNYKNGFYTLENIHPKDITFIKDINIKI